MKKIHARQLTLKIFMLRSKKISFKEFDIEKKFLRLENSQSPPPPITFLMVRPLDRFLTDFEQCRKQPQIA